MSSSGKTAPHHPGKAGNLALALGALGVVFGDIGTSPLYAFRECFLPEHGLVVNQANIYGILSLILWTLVLIISLKYMWFVLRADNKGEGGILSLMALSIRSSESNAAGAMNPYRRAILIALGLCGAALLFGEATITPAITVLSAVEGLKIVAPSLGPYIIPLTVVILCGLFLVQRIGTATIGAVFGPIIALWFLTLAFLGVLNILDQPQVLEAVNPRYAIDFFITNKTIGFISLAGVFLVVTGGEALYADMGHFGRTPIRYAWFILVLPALLLNYFGQGALLIGDPSKISNPFYLMAPDWALGYLLLISTMASIIASQALISGIYSVTRQAIQLGYVPRMPIIHTSSREIGQIYIPFINYLMLVGVLWLVLSFKTSSNLASAYGISVAATMVITTLLFFQVAMEKWKWSLWKVIPLFSLFFIIDLAFLGTNFLKISNGGWVTIAIAVTIYLMMTTWKEGRRVLGEILRSKTVPVEEFIDRIRLNPPHRVDGNAMYMSSETWGVPIPLLHNLKHNKVLHKHIGILTIRTKEVPYVPKKERVDVTKVGEGFYRIIAYYGFMEIPKIKHILEACRENGIQFTLHDTTFVLGRETILPTKVGHMPLWREILFAVMSRNAERPTAFFKIPPNQVIEVGIQVEI